MVAVIILERREMLQPFMQVCINKAYKPPCRVVVEWSDEIFTEARLRDEMLKFATQMGSASPQSVLERAGLDPEQEAARKIAAVDHPQMQKVNLPILDVSHGTTPAIHGVLDPKAEAEADRKVKAKKVSDKKTGKPKGTKDKS